MSTFGEDLMQSLSEALAHAKGEGPALVHAPMAPREVRKRAKLTQGSDGTLDGHEPVRLPQMGARHAPGERSGGGAVAGDPEGAGGREASIAVTAMERPAFPAPRKRRNKQVIEVLSKPVDRIGIDDVDSLIALKVPESEQIEFKATLPTKKRNTDPWVSGAGRVGDYARDAVLEEVTAFANAFGGTLLLGIRESDVRPSVAEAIAPVPRCAELSERLKLMFRDCVETAAAIVRDHWCADPGRQRRCRHSRREIAVRASSGYNNASVPD